MTKYSLLCIMVLMGSLLGCQRAQREPHIEQKVHTSSIHFTENIDVKIIPDIISSVFKDLGIQIEQRNQQSGHYVVCGESLSQETVNVKASALIIGKTVFVIEVEGQQQVSNALGYEIRNAITAAIRDYHRDKKSQQTN